MVTFSKPYKTVWKKFNNLFLKWRTQKLYHVQVSFGIKKDLKDSNKTSDLVFFSKKYLVTLESSP